MKPAILAAALLVGAALPALAEDRVTQAEYVCLTKQAYANVNDPELIKTCRIPHERVASAMDVIVTEFYPPAHGVRLATNWVEHYCRNQVAAWVCTYEGITRTYR